jgi:threonine synthase
MKRYYHNQFTIHDGSENIMYVLDPHTAVGVVAAETILEKQQGQGVIHTICLSTASPGKFPDAVLTAINKNPPQESIQQGFKPIEYRDIAPKILFDLTGRPQRMTLISTQNNKQKGLDAVRTAIVETLRPFGVSRL